MRRIICSIAVLALGLPVAPAQAREAIADRPAPQSAEQPLAATMDPTDPVSITVMQEERARAGGLGQVRIPIVRRSQTGPALRDVRARVLIPNGGRLTAVHGAGWTCRTRATSANCTADTLPSGQNPQPIYATFRVRRSWDKPAIRVDARAAWRGGPTAATKRQPWMVSATGTVAVSKPLTVALRSASGATIALATNGQAISRQFILLAKVGRIDGAQVQARWRQLSGPKVTMLQPALVRNVQSQVGQTIEVPDTVRGKPTMRFRLRVRGNGQTVVRTIRVRTLMTRLSGPSEIRHQQFQKLAKASTRPPKMVGASTKTRTPLRLVPYRNTWRITPGSATTVRISTPRKVASVQWFVDGSRAGTGSRITVEAPQTPWHSTLVHAAVTLKSGRVLQRSGLVTAAGGPRRLSAMVTDASDSDIATVCALATDTKDLHIDLGAGVTFTADRADVTADEEMIVDGACVGKGTVGIENGTLKHPGGTLTKVSATITAAAGLTITQAAWKLPPELSVAGVDSISLKPGTTPATAGLEDGAWKLLEGELTLAPIEVGPEEIDGLAWIPLGDGWRFAEGGSVISFLNSGDEHPEITDATLQFAQKITGPNALGIQLSADSADGSWNRLTVAASNIALGTTADGDTLMAAGKGSLDLDDAGSSLQLDVQCVKDGDPQADCELLTGLRLKQFSVELSAKKIALSGEAAIHYGTPAQDHDFSLSGSYESTDDWSLSVASTAPWDITDGMQLSELSGSISMAPKDGGSQLLASLTGTLTGLHVADSVTVKSLTPSITNTCPPEEQKCDTGEIRFAIAADVAATLPGGKEVDLQAGAKLNLTTLAFEFDFAYSGVQIGPDELNVTQAQFVLSNTPTGACTAHEAQAAQTDESALELGFLAKGSLLGEPITVGGDFSSAGYCLWGQAGAMDVGDSMDASPGVLTFTSYPEGADFTAPGQPSRFLQAKVISVHGTFDLPKDVDATFGIPQGALAYDATFDFVKEGVQFALSYTPTKPVSVYKGTGSELTLTRIGFQVSFYASTMEADLQLYADGALVVTGTAGTPDSVTPLGVSIGFSISPELVKASLQAGLLTESGPVLNAFGQKDFTVTKLAVSVAFSLPSAAPELSFNGAVNLPERWVGSIGIKNDARVALAFHLAEEAPCIKIEIGEQDATARTIVVDIANKGFLTAQYFKLIIAPMGCTVPVGSTGSETIAPGIGFAFDGAILGAPITVVIDADLSNGMALQGQLKLPALDLYAVKLQGYAPGTPLNIDLDIDTAASKYALAVDAGIQFGLPDKGVGALIRIKGALNTSDPDAVSFAMVGNGAVTFGLVGIDVKRLDVAVQVAKPGKDTSKNYANVAADLSVHSLGFVLNAGGQLAYNHGQLEQLRIYAGASVDILVASVSGTVEFDYCLGTLNGLSQSGSQCTVYANYVGASPAYRVGFYGKYRILWWSRNYLWTVYDQPGTQGNAPPSPSLQPEYVPGSIPTVVPKTISDATMKRYNIADLKWSSDVWLKSAYAADWNGIKACQTAKLGTSWTPSGAGDNPPIATVNPDPSGTKCALYVDISVGNGKSTRNAAVCDAYRCVAVEGQYIAKVLAADGAGGQQTKQGRDALIAGLRTPVGVLPAGTALIAGGQSGMVPSASGQDTLYATPDRLYLDRGGQIWAAQKEAASWMLGDDGLLVAQDADGAAIARYGTRASGDGDVFLFVQDGFSIWRKQASGGPKLVWGVDSKGGCVPEGASCGRVD